MKLRFSSLDVKIIAHELSNSLVSLRLANVYDLSTKIFLFKFAKPDNKKQLVVDSGFRCHLTRFARTTAAAPSDFVARLRKHLKTRRVTSVEQIGTDRIIQITFSDGQYRLFFEFYAGGNIILADRDLNILALLRLVPEGDGQEELRTGLKYSLENRQNYNGIPLLTKLRLQTGLQATVAKSEEATAGKKQKKKEGEALRRALALSITEFPPILVEHAMRVTGFDGTLKPADVLQSDELTDHLLTSLQEAQRVIEQITGSEITTGYIIAKRKDPTDSTSQENATSQRKDLLYDDFHPFKPRQFENDPECIIFAHDGFNITVDEFFSSIEGQKLESRLQEREDAAKRKIEAAKQDQAKRLDGLQEIQELNIRKAAAIESNVERVQEVMDAVNGLVAQAMDWIEIGKLIELEQKRGNAVARIIKLPLSLHENTVTVLLDEESLEFEDAADETDSDVSDSEDELPKTKVQTVADKRLAIDINLGETPWANAREYYDQRRTAVVKEQKTLQSSAKALKSTEQKVAHDLQKGLKQEKEVLRSVRQLFWFEKFLWFLSSEGYLVLGGRDAQQNEMLYKKHLRKGDVFVHADLPGACVFVIRNTAADAPIPPSTLSQAGTMVVASSNAWDSKAGMSAWWVTAEQVSKSTVHGDFLPLGGFGVKGNKNFLPPSVLLLGFAVCFQVSEESKARHLKHRVQDDFVKTSQTIEYDNIAGDTVSDEVKEEDSKRSIHVSSSDEDVASETDETERSSLPNPLQSVVRSVSHEVEIADCELQNLSISEEVEHETARDEDYQESEAVETDGHGEDNPVKGNSDYDESGTTKHPNQPSQNPTSAQSTKGKPALPRGKRTKAKKIAAKYRDQDDEDRQHAAEIIGSTAGLRKASAEAAAKAARIAEANFQKERRRAQHERVQAQNRAFEETRAAKLAVGATLGGKTGQGDDNDDGAHSVDLAAFVGTPLPNDDILVAIPMCAPWTALGTYKYKAKLGPGTTKKGKALREVLGTWVTAGKPSTTSQSTRGAPVSAVVDVEARDTQKIWPREMELLASWRVEELGNVVPVQRFRVVGAGSLGRTAGGRGGGGRGGRGGKRR